jgi:hypothetical protein
MKTATTLCLAVLLCAGIAAAADDTLTRTFDVESGGRIEFDLIVGGSMEFEGWDKDEIEIVFDARNDDIDDWDFDFEETRDGLVVRADLDEHHNIQTRLEARIMVPETFDIEFETAGGDVSIEGVTGRFEGRTAGGSISVRDVAGEADMKTGGGAISVINARLDGEIRTGGGVVTVQNVVGNLHATSGGGNVTYKKVRTVDGVMITPFGKAPEDTDENTVLIKSAGGRIDVDEAPAGAIVHTAGGNVRVRNADKFVRANTGGGDIEIELEEGWISAGTGAGDMVVSIDREGGERDIVLSSGHGDVTLIVPEGYGMDLDLEVRYVRESGRDYEIVTDSDVRTERSKDWERRRDLSNWVKYVTCDDEINGGGQKVRIKTTNGNITIKEK